ncbi:hypothetical protein [Rhodococcus sp. 5G237]
MSDGYFMPRHDQIALVAILDEIPELIEDLTIAITRQDRLSGGGPKTRNGSDEQPLPISVEAMEAADLLTDTLASWVRHTTEQRAMHYTAPTTAVHYAAWLKRWHVALAMSEGSDEALDEIRYAVRQARRATDRPKEHTPTIDQQAVYEAGEALLNATQIAHIAATMGDHYQGLNVKRVLRLRHNQQITPAMTADGMDLYRIADVLTAHLTYPARRRKIPA